MDSHADTYYQAQEQGQEPSRGSDVVACRIRHCIDYRLHIEPNGGTGAHTQECDHASQDPRRYGKNDHLHFSPILHWLQRVVS